MILGVSTTLPRGPVQSKPGQSAISQLVLQRTTLSRQASLKSRVWKPRPGGTGVVRSMRGRWDRLQAAEALPSRAPQTLPRQDRPVQAGGRDSSAEWGSQRGGRQVRQVAVQDRQRISPRAPKRCRGERQSAAQAEAASVERRSDRQPNISSGARHKTEGATKHTEDRGWRGWPATKRPT